MVLFQEAPLVQDGGQRVKVGLILYQFQVELSLMLRGGVVSLLQSHHVLQVGQFGPRSLIQVLFSLQMARRNLNQTAPSQINFHKLASLEFHTIHQYVFEAVDEAKMSRAGSIPG